MTKQELLNEQNIIEARLEELSKVMDALNTLQDNGWIKAEEYMGKSIDVIAETLALYNQANKIQNELKIYNR